MIVKTERHIMILLVNERRTESPLWSAKIISLFEIPSLIAKT